jgi:prepilin-type processing-associated H-X9-DG protein
MVEVSSPRHWAQGIACLFFLWVAAVILFPSHGTRVGVNARRSSCQSNLKQISLACLQYQQDYDEVFPLVSSREDVGWANLIFPYCKSWSYFNCAEERKPEARQSSDYFYNARLARVDALPKPGQVILFGDGPYNSPTNAHLLELPFRWNSDPESPARRHLDGANYAFADGHVKWLRPSLVDGSDGITPFTFEVKSRPTAPLRRPKK